MSKTSILIPCCPSHFHLLEEAVLYYNLQSTPPNEIVIALSGMETPSQETIDKLNKGVPVKLIAQLKNEHAGPNFNRAADNSSGDILICHGADDIPSSQRVERIVKVFDKNPLTRVILHQYSEQKEIPSNPSHILKNFWEKCIYAEDKPSTVELGTFNFKTWGKYKFALGPISIRREVFNHCRWGEKQKGQDFIFLNAIMNVIVNAKEQAAYDDLGTATTEGRIGTGWKVEIILEHLYLYRNWLSSWGQTCGPPTKHILSN